MRVHIKLSVGRVRLKALTPAHMRALYRERLDSGVLHVHRALSKALKQAHDDGLVPRNVAGPVKPPRPRGVLGHADISLTLNVYSHILRDMGDDAAGAMDAALG